MHAVEESPSSSLFPLVSTSTVLMPYRIVCNLPSAESSGNVVVATTPPDRTSSNHFFARSIDAIEYGGRPPMELPSHDEELADEDERWSRRRTVLPAFDE